MQGMSLSRPATIKDKYSYRYHENIFDIDSATEKACNVITATGLKTLNASYYKINVQEG